MKVNPEQIAYLSYQIRQLEVERNASKKKAQKEAMTLRIRNLKAELDPILMAYAEEKKKAKMEILDENKDFGPKYIVDTLHDFAKTRLTQEDFVNLLKTGPMSVAGEYDKVAYVIHFQRTETL